MITFSGSDATEVWENAVKLLSSSAPIQESRDQMTKELLHATFTIENPRQRVVFSRPINPAFAITEVLWILAGGNDVSFLKFWNPRISNYSDNGTYFHGAYGYRLGSAPVFKDKTLAKKLRHEEAWPIPRINQIKQAFEALQITPYSRQVVLQIWNNYTDLPTDTPRSKDIPCNLMSHLMVRNDKLEWLQIMRSNDLIWGSPYNFIQFTTLQETIAGWLNIDVGTYNHVSDSLHVYQRHFSDLEEIAKQKKTKTPVNKADLRIFSYKEWEKVLETMLLGTYELAKAKTDTEIYLIHKKTVQKVPPAYQELFSLLAAEALRRKEYTKESYLLIDEAGEYWKTSWKQWADTFKTKKK